MNTAAQVVEEAVPVSDYYVEFLLVNGESFFRLLDSENKYVTNGEIVVDSKKQQLNFYLELLDAPDASWASYFEWEDSDTGESSKVPPKNITFTKESWRLVKLCDFNTAEKAGHDCQYPFKMVVVVDGVYYESKDPVIINKKPPE